MASTASMPRTLARLSSAHPPTMLTLRPAHLRASPQLLQPRRAYASKAPKAPPKTPPVLEKPDAFRPPSHPAKLPTRRSKPKYDYGPRLTPAEQAAQRTKKYPNMMPPAGSFMHWFLTNRMLHVYIAFSVLFSLAGYTFWMNFLTTTPYRDLLPSRGDVITHPWRSVRQAASVYRMHAEHVSAETAERRKMKVEDVDKRAEFRKAHGMEEEGGKGWWGGERAGASAAAAEVDVQSPVAPAEGEEGFRDFEGKPQRRPVKKWLGIW